MSAGTRVVPALELLQKLAAGKRLLGIAVTQRSVEVAVIGPPYDSAKLLRTGSFLSPEELSAVLDEAKAEAVVLGGSGAFRTDGSTQLGVRKLISGLQGLVYDNDWMPSAAPRSVAAQAAVPIWFCRGGQDDAARLVVDHVQAHTTPQQRLVLRGMADTT
ncbi:hypothetical protein PLESTB_001480000 [Pleodorina starrii]|uniref:Uncharacterized protein n=1 Tax=Pleodorina starrii TaxID=330485 RepID=A0A9W6BW80_9CHLO|nr:hypothetical protein PLESTM_000651500 [Pleodorina starrii]GLC59379.1 hypothetical protein PLESTB_001480000 [Pleodorina starrii]GLC74422.1 hypothetical protein PLESTF_001511300 [Pleodorina starrii]